MFLRVGLLVFVGHLASWNLPTSQQRQNSRLVKEELENETSVVSVIENYLLEKLMLRLTS